MGEIVKLDLDAMLARFAFLGRKLAPTVYVAMLVSAQRMVADVVKKRMSGPRGAPGILGVVTGAARRSMADRAGTQADSVFAAIDSDLGYVKVHEEGFHGTVAVRAHERRRLGRVKAVSIAKATKGQVSRRFAVTAAQRRAGPIHVRASQRKMNVKAKWFIRDTVREAVGPTEDRISRALIIAARTGRVPTPSEVGG